MSRKTMLDATMMTSAASPALAGAGRPRGGAKLTPSRVLDTSPPITPPSNAKGAEGRS